VRRWVPAGTGFGGGTLALAAFPPDGRPGPPVTTIITTMGAGSGSAMMLRNYGDSATNITALTPTGPDCTNVTATGAPVRCASAKAADSGSVGAGRAAGAAGTGGAGGAAGDSTAGATGGAVTSGTTGASGAVVGGIVVGAVVGALDLAPFSAMARLGRRPGAGDPSR